MTDISRKVSQTNKYILIFVLSPALVAFTANKDIKYSVLVQFSMFIK